MLSPRRPFLSFILFVLSLLPFSVEAQDYRANSRPREMVQPAPQQRGLFDLIFGRRQADPEPYYQAPRAVSRQPANPYISPDRNIYPDRNVYPQNNNNFVNPDARRKAVPTTKVGAQGTGLYCVRSCDGFFFPIANTSKVVDGKGAQQEACNTLCPGAEVEVYRSSSYSIEEAMNATTRKSYKAHPKAFAFREKIENTCSCKGFASRGLARIPYNRDYTLKAGDVVLLDNGAHVFDGGDGFPYKNRDFASVSRGSSRLSAELRQMMVAKNVPMGTSVSRQVASRDNNVLADSTSFVDLEPLTGTSKSVRTIDILGKAKERPVLVIDIIQQIKQSRS